MNALADRFLHVNIFGELRHPRIFLYGFACIAEIKNSIAAAIACGLFIKRAENYIGRKIGNPEIMGFIVEVMLQV